MTSELLTTPLHGWHATHGGRMVDFAGWSMPVQYSSIMAEHQATRTAGALFDISHMGRLRFDGSGAAAFLDSIVTRRVTDLKPGRVRYGLVTNEAGGILDDVLVYHLQDAAGGSYHLMVVNASNRSKIVSWIEPRLSAAKNVSMADVTTAWAMIAAQGPRSLELVQPLVQDDLAGMKFYTGRETRIGAHSGIVSRTGYTGEDGFELIVGAFAVEALWTDLLERGAAHGVLPAGLGARDTLRLEAAMPLYGHELSESIDPLTAGLDFAVNLDGRDFIGSRSLRKISADGTATARVGLELEGKRAAREGSQIFAPSSSQLVGQVTSGTFSPTLNRPIAMGYLQREWSRVGASLLVDIRGRQEGARVVALPFYQRQA